MRIGNFNIRIFRINPMNNTFDVIEYINGYLIIAKVNSQEEITPLETSIFITTSIYLLTSISFPCLLKLQFLIDYSITPSAMIPVIVEAFSSLTDLN